MSKQTTKNCHWISRMMTKPWEIDEQRNLRYYDFVTRQLKTRNSARLFARDDLNSQPVEDWLNRMLETPLGEVRESLLAGDLTALDDWRHYRAVVLMLWLQGRRGQEAVFDPPTEGGIATIAADADSRVNALVASICADYDLVTLGTVDPQRLFFPSSGLFGISVTDPGCLTGSNWGLAMPLDPRMAIAAVPTSAVRVQEITARLMPLSLGNSAYAEQVVIPPDVLNEYSENEIISIVTTYRSMIDEWQAAKTALRSESRDFYSLELAMEIHVDGVDRLRPGPSPLPPTAPVTTT